MLYGRCGGGSVAGETALKVSDAVERLFRAGIILFFHKSSFRSCQILTDGPF